MRVLIWQNFAWRRVLITYEQMDDGSASWLEMQKQWARRKAGNPKSLCSLRRVSGDAWL